MESETGTVVIEVAYGEGWDLAARALVRPLSREAALARDGAGLPYAVTLRIPGREAPLEVRLVSWRDHYAGVWVYDAEGRRTHHLDLRLLDGDRLLHRLTRHWEYADAGTPEFDDGCARTTLELFPDGRGSLERRRPGPGGGTLVTTPDLAEEERWLARPAFGEWPLFSAEAAQAAVLENAPFREAEVEPGAGVEPREEWHPPRPGGYGDRGALFQPGTRLATRHHPEMTVLEPDRSLQIRIPGGVLAVDAPDNGDGPAFTIPVPPGTYPLETARLSYGYDCEFRGRWVTTTDLPAVRLRLSDAPPVRWEMALGEDHDPRLLPDGGAYGFDTDSATGCFADGAAWEPLKRLYARALFENDETAGEDLSGNRDSMFLMRTSDEATGADLMAFATGGDGTYAVWLGRAASGDLACVDIQVGYLPDLRVLSDLRP
ncbi:DUF4241 domain-containing protein [Streptomyces sp. NPDC093546]|uniref:DUF4241 domain-containing protein n=1 Tax=Streptomyces sp. NPDC093546 TaxID=3366040 RepID=UPI003806B6FC